MYNSPELDQFKKIFTPSGDIYPYRKKDALKLMVKASRQLIEKSVDLLFIDDGSYVLSDAIDQIDMTLHENEELVDTDLSTNIDSVLQFSEYLDKEKHIPLKEFCLNVKKYNIFVYRDIALDKIHTNFKEIIPFITQPSEIGADALNINVGTFNHNVNRLINKLGLQSKKDLALWAQVKGYDFGVNTLVKSEDLSTQERYIATYICLSDKELSSVLKLTDRRIQQIVQSLFNKTGAKNRIELALMAFNNNFQLTQSEKVDMQIPKGLEPYTPTQRKYIAVMFLPYNEIAKLHNTQNDNISLVLSRAQQISGTSTKIEFALHLLNSGYVFKINQPLKPLNKIFTKLEFDIANSPYLPKHELIEKFNFSSDQMDGKTSLLRAKSGARTNIELALMARLYDSGLYLEKSRMQIKSREEQFMEKFGAEIKSFDKLREFLKFATPKQQQYIKAYYLSDKNPTWKEIANENNVFSSVPHIVAFHGIKKIIKIIKQENVIKNIVDN